MPAWTRKELTSCGVRNGPGSVGSEGVKGGWEAGVERRGERGEKERREERGKEGGGGVQ